MSLGIFSGQGLCSLCVCDILKQVLTPNLRLSELLIVFCLISSFVVEVAEMSLGLSDICWRLQLCYRTQLNFQKCLKMKLVTLCSKTFLVCDPIT